MPQDYAKLAKIYGGQAVAETADPEALTGWRGVVDQGLNAVVGGVKGLTGLGDQGPAGPTVINAAALAGAISPKGLGSLAKTLMKGGKPGVYALKPQTVDRLAHFYEIGQAQPSVSNWEGVTEELLNAFGGDKDQALRWSRLWGATSPNTSVPVNTRESISALRYGLENPHTAMTVPVAQTIDPKITMAPSKVPNINNAYAGRPLSGDKVEAMAGFMTGDARAPLDVHMLHALGSDADKLSPELPALRALMTKLEKLPPRGALTDTDIYLRYEHALKEALIPFNKDRTFNAIFAQTWEGTRAAKGLKPQGGPIDILRAKGLLEPGAMLDPKYLTQVLASQGWKAPAILSLLGAIHADPQTPGDPVGPT